MEEIGPILFSILVVSFLIFLNAAFVAAEFAIARVRRTRIDDIAEGKDTKYQSKLKKKQAKLVQEILNHMNDYISTCQIGITIASLILGAYAEARFETFLEPLLHLLPFELDVHVVSITLALMVITYFHVVLGEVVPKSMALAKPESVSLNLAHFLSFVHSTFHVPVVILNESSNWFLRLIRIDPVIGEVVHSEAELKRILSTSQEEGILEEEEEEMIQNIFEFNDTVAKEIMTPRTDMLCLDENLTIEEAVKRINEEGYSRYPIFKERLDNITGYVIIKEVFKELAEGRTKVKLKSIAQLPLKVPDGVFVIDLMKELQRKKKQLAILIDEFGGTSGLVTTEDIVEEIFGEIQDETESPEEPIIKLSNGHVIVDGLMSLENVNEEIGSDFSSEHYETIGGFVFGLVGPHPRKGDKVDHESYTLVVEKHERQRVRSVRIIPLSTENSA